MTYHIIYHVSCITHSHPPTRPPPLTHPNTTIATTSTSRSFTPQPLYNPSLLHKKACTPEVLYYTRRFLQQERLCTTNIFYLKQKPFTPNTFYSPSISHEPAFASEALRAPRFCNPFSQKQERFTPQTFCTKQFLHHKLFVPHSFVTKSILLHTPLLPEALCITRLLHQKPFAPQYTTMRIQQHFLAWKSQQGYTAPAQPSDAKRINDTLLQRNHDAKRDQNTYIIIL